MTRGLQRNTQKEGICTEFSTKEAHSSKQTGFPRWQSVFSYFDPRATNQHPMIREIKGPRLEAAKRSIEALNLTPYIPFVFEYPSSSPIPVVDSDFLIEEVDTLLVLEDSIPPGIESDFDSEGDIIFYDLLNDDPIPEYECFTFDIEPDTPVINNFDELNKDECFDLWGGEIVFSQNVEDDDSFTLVIRTFLMFLTYPEDSPLLLSTGSEDTIFDLGIST
ncbi:hypothetical protein Tco_1444345 [Tanacetum coccineum]